MGPTLWVGRRRALHSTMLRTLLTTTFTLLALDAVALAQSMQSLAPAVAFSVHDEPVDGAGDLLNAPPFEGLIRTQSTRADRALHEYDVTGLAGAAITSATLTGRVSVNNAFNNGTRTFDFLLYDADGVVDLADYQVAATVVGSGQYAPPAQSSFDYSFDVTAAVQALVAGGATHVGLRVEGTSSPNFPNILSSSLGRLEVTTGASLGASYCGPAVPNSVGVSARIAAQGSAVAASNALTLSALALPQQSFGFFLTSRAQGLAVGPGGSQGNLCLGSPIGRYVGPGEIGNSGTAGTFSLLLDLTRTPTPNGFVAAQAGETWNFQAWYRDVAAGMATSNFTDGVSVMLQ